MRLVLAVLAVITVGSLGTAVADETSAPPESQAPATAPAPAAAAAPAAPAAPAAAAPAAAAPAATAKADAGTDAKEKHLLAEGYKTEMHNGDKVFCRKEEILGSRLGGHKVCGSAVDLIAREAADKANTELTERQGRSGKIPGP
jgi:hypothetical protein